MGKKAIIIVGFGDRSRKWHMQAIKALSADFEISGVIDGSHEAVAEAERLGVRGLLVSPAQTMAPEALERLLAGIRHDFLILACPPEYRLPFFRYAARKGIAILCEKPLFAVPNMTSSPAAAARLRSHVEEMLAIADEIPVYTAGMRRRFNPEVIQCGEFLSDVGMLTGMGVSSMNAFLNTGLWRFAGEFEKEGAAHGFGTGNGTASYTMFHIVDLVAWFVGESWGSDGIEWDVSVTHMSRVGDLVGSEPYARTLAFMGAQPPTTLSCDARSAEFDWSCSIRGRLDSVLVVQGNLTCCASGVTRRAGPETALRGMLHDPDGIRMEQIQCIFQCGGLASVYYVVDNETDRAGQNLYISRRLNPRLAQRLGEPELVEGNYENRIPGFQRDITIQQLRHFNGESIKLPKGGLLKTQKSTYNLFLKIVEAMAAAHQDRFSSKMDAMEDLWPTTISSTTR